ncbi:MAG: glucose-1-phosphate cytidylyltransferase [Thermodesulfobacteriota bacterium]
MKTVILAGGFGSRLGNLTEAIPKPMVLVGGKPIIWHIMKYYSCFGYHDFIISCGYKANVLKEYFYNYYVYDNDFTIDYRTKRLQIHYRQDGAPWSVTVADTGLNSLKGARLKRIEKYLDEGANMITYGDGVSNVDLRKLVEFHNRHGKVITITGVHPPSRFGEIIEKDGRITSFLEKPQTSIGIINGGFMVFNRKLLDYLSLDEKCDLEYGPFEQLAREEEIMVFTHSGQWECVDTERDLNHLNKLWNEGKAFWKIW